MCEDRCDLTTCEGDLGKARYIDLSGCRLGDFPESLRDTPRLRKVKVDTLPLGVDYAKLRDRVRIIEKRPREVRGEAQWKRSGRQRYLSVEADDRYSLGYLEGKKLLPKILAVKLAVDSLGVLKKGGKDYAKLAEKYLEHIPDEYAEEMIGIADGAGKLVKFGDIVLQNAFLDIQYGQIIPDEAKTSLETGCTVIGAINEDGTTMIGQNLDLDPLISHALVFVLHKIPDRHGVFSLRLGAALSLPIWKNSEGVVSTISVVKTNLNGSFGEPGSVTTRKSAEKAATAREAVKMALEDTLGNPKPQTASFNLMVADDHDLYSLQVHPKGYERRGGKEEGGLLVNTNRYLNESWNEKYFAEGDYSLVRQQRAEREARLAFGDGNLTNAELMDILSLGKDGDLPESEICRTSGDSHTLAFMTKDSFGLGTPRGRVGDIHL